MTRTCSPFALCIRTNCVQNGAALIDALTTVLRNVTKEETVQYVLALLDNIVTSESSAPHTWVSPHENSTLCSCSVRGSCSVLIVATCLLSHRW